jgi:hypothetical protein
LATQDDAGRNAPERRSVDVDRARAVRLADEDLAADLLALRPRVVLPRLQRILTLVSYVAVGLPLAVSAGTQAITTAMLAAGTKLRFAL